MSLLELELVVKRHPQARHAVLNGVSMELDEGELAVVWGLRSSGRSTLLRIAAGIDAPDSGAVHFAGEDLAHAGERLLGGAIGYCHKTLPIPSGQAALEHVMVPLLAHWSSTRTARVRAREALAHVGAAHCEGMRQRELSSAERVRVAIARTLTLRPRLIVIDEPVYGVELIERDEVLVLLRSLANEGIAVLASTGESTGLSEADRGFVLGGGELRGAPVAEHGEVLPLRRRHASRASA